MSGETKGESQDRGIRSCARDTAFTSTRNATRIVAYSPFSWVFWGAGTDRPERSRVSRAAGRVDARCGTAKLDGRRDPPIIRPASRLMSPNGGSQASSPRFSDPGERPELRASGYEAADGRRRQLSRRASRVSADHRLPVQLLGQAEPPTGRDRQPARRHQHQPADHKSEPRHSASRDPLCRAREGVHTPGEDPNHAPD